MRVEVEVTEVILVIVDVMVLVQNNDTLGVPSVIVVEPSVIVTEVGWVMVSVIVVG